MCILIFVPGLLPISRSPEDMSIAVMCCVCALGCLFAAGPNELQIDLRRRIYRKVLGFPNMVTTGSLDSLGDAYVMTAGASQYWVLLRKAPGDGRGFLLGTFSNRIKAQAMVQEINTQLQLQLT